MALSLCLSVSAFAGGSSTSKGPTSIGNPTGTGTGSTSTGTPAGSGTGSTSGTGTTGGTGLPPRTGTDGVCCERVNPSSPNNCGAAANNPPFPWPSTPPFTVGTQTQMNQWIAAKQACIAAGCSWSGTPTVACDDPHLVPVTPPKKPGCVSSGGQQNSPTALECSFPIPANSLPPTYTGSYYMGAGPAGVTVTFLGTPSPNSCSVNIPGLGLYTGIVGAGFTWSAGYVCYINLP